MINRNKRSHNYQYYKIFNTTKRGNERLKRQEKGLTITTTKANVVEEKQNINKGSENLIKTGEVSHQNRKKIEEEKKALNTRINSTVVTQNTIINVQRIEGEKNQKKSISFISK